MDELLNLDGLELNTADGPLTLESLTFTPGQKKPLWVDNADADGEALVDETRYTNSSFAGRIRFLGDDMDEALSLVGQFTDKLQKAERMADLGGIPMLWTPADLSTSYTWYPILGEYTEVPIEPNGDLAGWFIDMPVLGFKLTCRPFGEGEEAQVLAPVESSAPMHVAILSHPGGDVPALGRIRVIDKATQDRRHAEWGLEQLDSDEDDPSDLLDSDSLLTAGFAGVQTTREGSYDPNASGNNVIRATAITAPLVLCSTGSIENIGSFRVKPRIYALSEDIRVRAVYRVGDGPFKPLEWKRPVVINAFSELDLGEANLERIAKGDQRSEVRIEVKSLGANSAVDLDLLFLIPTSSGYGKARGLASDDPASLTAYDEFDQSSGSLTGGYTPNAISAITAANPGVITATSHGLSNGDRVWIEGIVGTMSEVLTGFFTVAGVTTNTFNVGVNTTGKGYTSGGKVSKAGKALPFPATSKWFGAGDTDDGSVATSNHTLQRTAVSDASLTAGRFFFPDLEAAAAVKAQASFTGSNEAVMASASIDVFRFGPFVRYKNAENWLMAVLSNPVTKDNVEEFGTTPYMALKLIKCVVGSLSTISVASSGVVPNDKADLSSVFVAVSVDADGIYQVWCETDGTPLISPRISGMDSVLATGGALASGRSGVYDAWTSASACTRTIDKVNILAAPAAGRVCYANQSAELDHEGYLREDADGDDWGAPSMYRGAGFYLPSPGDTEAVNRLALKLRRSDTDSEADSAIADKHQLEVLATPRFLIPR